jgi:cytochrome b pre-mRNA-processing protein 3
MILAHFRRKSRTTSIDSLYGAIVAQARQRIFYAGYAVPDTVEGRLDMIMLHTVLLLHRLNGESDACRALGQAVFDRFCLDMDDNLREMGVGDLAVPKQMQRIAAAFYGRAKAYEEALSAAQPGGLVEALARNIYANDPAAQDHAGRLAAYARDAVAHLAGQSAADLATGRVGFPVLM